MIRTALSAFFIALIFLSPSHSVQAQMPVHIEATTPDSVGNRLVFAMREAIRRSSSMTLEDRAEDGFLLLKVVTLNPDESARSNRTIYSIVWISKTLHETPVQMYLTNSVGLCGTSRVQHCAEDIVAETDRQASFIRGLLRAIH